MSDDATKPDLSMLKSMVGVRNGLSQMLQKGAPLTLEAVLVLLDKEKASYAGHAGFREKDKALGPIIAALRDGTLGVDELLAEAGLDPKLIKTVSKSAPGKKSLFGKKPK